MKTTTVIALSLILGFINLNPVLAAEDSEDPLSGFDDFFSQLGSFENEEDDFGFDSESLTETDVETSNEGLQSSSPNTESETTSNSTVGAETQATTKSARASHGWISMPEIPEGKENFLLYRIPGALLFGGMTFLRIDSPKFFNKFQKCNTPSTDVITNRLSLLKLSQGSPRECREDMKRQFVPYKTFRTKR